MATDTLEPQTAVGELTADQTKETAGITEADTREIKKHSSAGGADPPGSSKSKGGSTRGVSKGKSIRKSVSFDATKVAKERHAKLEKAREKPISRTSNGFSIPNTQGDTRAAVSRRATMLMKAKSERLLIVNDDVDDPNSQSTASRKSSISTVQRRSRRLSAEHQSGATENGSQASSAAVPALPKTSQRRMRRLSVDHPLRTDSGSQTPTTPQRRVKRLSVDQSPGGTDGGKATTRRTKSGSMASKKSVSTSKSPGGRRAMLKKSVSASFLIDADDDEQGGEEIQQRKVSTHRRSTTSATSKSPGRRSALKKSLSAALLIDADGDDEGGEETQRRKSSTHRMTTTSARRSSSQRRRTKRLERVSSKGEPVAGTRRRSNGHDKETPFLAPLKDAAKEFVSSGTTVRSRRQQMSKIATEQVMKVSESGDNNLGAKPDNTARRNRNVVRNSHLPVAEALESKLKRSSFFNENEDANGESNHEQLMPAFYNRKELEVGELLGEGATSMVHELKAVRLPSEKVPNDESMLRKRFGLDFLDNLSFSQKQTCRQAFEENVSSSNIRYVLKHIPSSLLAEAEKFQAAVVNLATEAHYLARLDHENIVKIHALPIGGVSVLHGGHFENFFTVLNRFDETLSHRITRWKGGYRSKENTNVNKLRIASQVAEAVKYLHSKRILHRDVKPDNIGLLGDNLVQLFDFTRCRDLPPQDQGTALNNIADGELIFQMTTVGLSRYMAPEIKQLGNYNLKADVYSWAILCYEILSLNKAYNDISEDDLEDRVVLKGERPPLSESGLPLDVQELLSTAWDQNLEKRSSITEVCNQLEHVLWILREPSKKISMVPPQEPDPQTSFSFGDSYTQDLHIPFTKPTVKKVNNFMESGLDESISITFTEKVRFTS